ncbi:MAG: hypothetical protein KF861_20170 [Planctomycetaceae bacterium]|nr:hypothetical protein [Planctomycetaceae bacterium]
MTWNKPAWIAVSGGETDGSIRRRPEVRRKIALQWVIYAAMLVCIIYGATTLASLIGVAQVFLITAVPP